MIWVFIGWLIFWWSGVIIGIFYDLKNMGYVTLNNFLMANLVCIFTGPIFPLCAFVNNFGHDIILFGKKKE